MNLVQYKKKTLSCTITSKVDFSGHYTIYSQSKQIEVRYQ